MKTIITTLILLAALSAAAAPVTLKIAWDANPESENVVSYNVYLGGPLETDWTDPASVTATTYLIPPSSETYQLIGVTAVNDIGLESDKATISYPKPPSIPAGLKVSVSVTINVDAP